MINCLICGKEYIQIAHNHMKTHNLTLMEYKEQFPNAVLQDESMILKGKTHPCFGNTGELAPMYGKKHSENSKKQCSESHLKYWNSDISATHRITIAASMLENKPWTKNNR